MWNWSDRGCITESRDWIVKKIEESSVVILGRAVQKDDIWVGKVMAL
jgi:hypothetical protein